MIPVHQNLQANPAMPQMTSTALRVRPSLLCAILFALFLSTAARAQDRADVSAALNVSALQPGKPAVIAVVLDVKPGYHAQSHTPLSENLIKTEVMLDESPAIEHDAAVYPPGRVESYPQLGKLSVYTGKTILYVPLRVKPNAPL